MPAQRASRRPSPRRAAPARVWQRTRTRPPGQKLETTLLGRSAAGGPRERRRPLQKIKPPPVKPVATRLLKRALN
jgi:hypothetical protein